VFVEWFCLSLLTLWLFLRKADKIYVDPTFGTNSEQQSSNTHQELKATKTEFTVSPHFLHRHECISESIESQIVST